MTAGHCVKSRPIASLAVALGFDDLTQATGDHSVSTCFLDAVQHLLYSVVVQCSSTPMNLGLY